MPDTYAIEGELDLVPHEAPSEVTALANPFASDELALATTTVDADGAFRLVMVPLEEDLLIPATSLLPETPECSDRRLEPSHASLLFVSRYVLTGPDGGHIGDLQRSSEPTEDGSILSETHVFTTWPIHIEATCVFDQSVFEFDLDLDIGWNAFRIHSGATPDDPFRLTSRPPAYDLAWRLQPSPPAAPIPMPSSRSAADEPAAPSSTSSPWPWLLDLVAPTGVAER